MRSPFSLLINALTVPSVGRGGSDEIEHDVANCASSQVYVTGYCNCKSKLIVSDEPMTWSMLVTDVSPKVSYANVQSAMTETKNSVSGLTRI